MFKKSNIPSDEQRAVTITCIVDGGKNTGLAGRVSGELIDKLEDVFHEISIYLGGGEK